MMFKSLSQAAMGLKLLYRSGFVHRDRSLGNLFSCEDGNCKISDSEYAKPYELPPNSIDRVVDEDDQDVKVGTPAFMAVELQLHLKNHPQESNPPSPNPGHSLTGKVA
ncbi:hypothetical protein QCA50_016770 [Cerrena zonata]|uniref:Protein kinase domain-containing protein n=1 Tax=Cerrena zonata TaxID=2478898 RepID=A0AAW0FHM8_9APHY